MVECLSETSLKTKTVLDLAPNQHNLFVFDFSRNLLWKGWGDLRNISFEPHHWLITDQAIHLSDLCRRVWIILNHVNPMFFFKFQKKDHNMIKIGKL